MCTVSDFYTIISEQTMWNIHLHSEAEAFSDLLCSVSSFTIHPFIDDSLHSWPDPSVLFSVKAFYKWKFVDAGIVTVNPKIWSSKTPPREISFFWTTGLGKILTQDNLRKRSRILVSACPFLSSTS